MKKTFDELLRELEQAISKKINTINEQSCDTEVLAFISLYRYGAKEHSEFAKKWLSKFLVNANFINKKGII